MLALLATGGAAVTRTMARPKRQRSRGQGQGEPTAARTSDQWCGHDQDHDPPTTRPPKSDTNPPTGGAARDQRHGPTIGTGWHGPPPGGVRATRPTGLTAARAQSAARTRTARPCPRPGTPPPAQTPPAARTRTAADAGRDGRCKARNPRDEGVDAGPQTLSATAAARPQADRAVLRLDHPRAPTAARRGPRHACPPQQLTDRRPQPLDPVVGTRRLPGLPGRRALFAASRSETPTPSRCRAVVSRPSKVPTGPEAEPSTDAAPAPGLLAGSQRREGTGTRSKSSATVRPPS